MAYLKNSNRSDREIGKELGFSQPTVSRLKEKLTESGIVTRFSAIPDLSKIGFEILVFSLIQFNKTAVNANWPKVVKIAKNFAKNNPEILFDSIVEGEGVDAISISVHQNYAAYKEFLIRSKNTWGELLSDVKYVLVDLNGPLNKPFSFDALLDYNDKMLSH